MTTRHVLQNNAFKLLRHETLSAVQTIYSTACHLRAAVNLMVQTRVVLVLIIVCTKHFNGCSRSPAKNREANQEGKDLT